ncbi:MAG: hypothetical protein ACI9LN_001072, partial [Saprospiraceae bacterium]
MLKVKDTERIPATTGFAITRFVKKPNNFHFDKKTTL